MVLASHGVFGEAPAPMPARTRPPLIRCALDSPAASTAGWRWATLATNVPSPIVVVATASAPSKVQHSNRSHAAGERGSVEVVEHPGRVEAVGFGLQDASRKTGQSL